ncbi:hypothetical protein GOV13_05200 [Candidatus Pacearchaeota archaeon]|nr:hypothetical protein [Candidatus Pacearchaeota archaeon]
MKIYVATTFENKEKLLEIHKKIKEMGHEIAYDWTTHKPIKPYDKNKDLAIQYSSKDIEGVDNCDIFILISNEKISPGMHTEFGAAIFSNMKYGKPLIYVVGEHTSNSIFYFHPSVKIVDSVDEVISEIGVNKEQI